VKDMTVTKHCKAVDSLLGNRDGVNVFYCMVLTLYVVLIILALF